jgi:4-amino-4-deoxy-L-arabinose transferase-like glycosyltransferase
VFFVTLSVYGLLRHLLQGPQWRWYFIGWFAAGLGVITKGVGFLALFMLVPYIAARWHGGFGLPSIPARDWRWYVLPLGLPLAAAVWVGPVLWYVLVDGDPALRAYANDIFLRQTAGRFVDPWDHTGKGAFYFVEVMLKNWVPLTLALPWLLPAWWRRIRARHDARFLLPVIWVLLVIVFFSLSPGKRDVYILPALPMLALAAAPLMGAIARRAVFRHLVFWLAALIGTGLLLAGLLAVFGEPSFEARQEAARGLADGDSAWWMVAVVGVIGVAGAIWARPRRALAAWAIGFGAVWVLAFGFWGYPLLNDASSARGVMAQAREAAGAQTTIGLVAWREQNLLMLDGPHHDFGFSLRWGEQRRLALDWLAQSPQTRRVFIFEGALGPCIDRNRLTSLGVANRRAWYLFGADALVPGCVDDGASNERVRGDRSLRLGDDADSEDDGI